MQEQRPAERTVDGRSELSASSWQERQGGTPVCTTMPPTPVPDGVIGPFHIYDAPSYDLADGPTHQPGVFPGHEYAPLRTPFGDVGVPGAGRERNVTDLDLAKNQHPSGDPLHRIVTKVPVCSLLPS